MCNAAELEVIKDQIRGLVKQAKALGARKTLLETLIEDEWAAGAKSPQEAPQEVPQRRPTESEDAYEQRLRRSASLRTMAGRAY